MLDDMKKQLQEYKDIQNNTNTIPSSKDNSKDKNQGFYR
jgi:hypothetical protein